MSLHVTLSTLCRNVASLRGRQSAGMLVEFLFWGKTGSVEFWTAEITNYLNQDAGNFPAIDSKTGHDGVFPQLDKFSGRYRQKRAVPI